MNNKIARCHQAGSGTIILVVVLACLCLFAAWMFAGKEEKGGGEVHQEKVEKVPSPNKNAESVVVNEQQAKLVEKLEAHFGVTNLGDDRYQLGLVKFDSRKKEMTFPAKVNMSHGVVEYALVKPSGKTHEALMVSDVNPMDIQIASLLLSGSRTRDTDKMAVKGLPVEVELQWVGADGAEHKCSLLEVIEAVDGSESEEKPPSFPWRYSGDVMANHLGGGVTPRFDGSLIALIRDPSALINNIWIKQDPKNRPGSGSGMRPTHPGEMQANRNVHGNQRAKKHALPPKGTDILIRLTIYQQPKEKSGDQ